MKIQRVSFSNPSFGSNRKKFDVQGHIGTMYDNGQKVTYTMNVFEMLKEEKDIKYITNAETGEIIWEKI